MVEDQAEVREVRGRGAGGLRLPGDPGGERRRGAAALRAGAHTIHLVLTDVVMPNVSGRELADRLERLRPGIKVLFMSGYTDESSCTTGSWRTARQFIQKPFSPEELVKKVRRVLGGAQAD